MIRALSTTFPHVQFIMTTHLPIVISSAKEANVILLDEDKEVTYLLDSYGYKVDDVLSSKALGRPFADVEKEVGVKMIFLEKVYVLLKKV